MCISHATGPAAKRWDGGARCPASRLPLRRRRDHRAGSRPKEGIDPAEVADEERRKSLVVRMLEGIAQSAGDASALARQPLAWRRGEELSSDDIRVLIRETVAADRGPWRGGDRRARCVPCSSPVRSEALRVLVTASPRTVPYGLRTVGASTEPGCRSRVEGLRRRSTRLPGSASTTSQRSRRSTTTSSSTRMRGRSTRPRDGRTGRVDLTT